MPIFNRSKIFNNTNETYHLNTDEYIDAAIKNVYLADKAPFDSGKTIKDSLMFKVATVDTLETTCVGLGVVKLTDPDGNDSEYIKNLKNEWNIINSLDISTLEKQVKLATTKFKYILWFLQAKKPRVLHLVVGENKKDYEHRNEADNKIDNNINLNKENVINNDVKGALSE